MQAFRGDPACKEAIVRRVRAGWDAGAIVPLIYLKWSDGGGLCSLAGTIAQTQDPDRFVAATGLPLQLALLAETLINAGIGFVDDAAAPRGFTMQGDPEIWAFGVAWIEAIGVGVDVEPVVPRFLPVFVARVLADDAPLSAHVDPAVRAAGRAIADLWMQELRGEAVAPSQWRSVRRQALSAADAAQDPAGWAVAELVESLPWPGTGIATELPAICQRFLNAQLNLLAARASSEEDWRAWTARIDTDRELARLRGDPVHAELSDAALLERFPAVRAGIDGCNAATMARIDAARPAARSAMTAFLRALMDDLLTVLREPPG